ncbi:MAG: tyrosine-type recombinase/integrase [Candidatus Aureabacteria bacterium]|nr:tyrosine-type recombinase/integrase [Candidatus Auribacterota bacterium]
MSKLLSKLNAIDENKNQSFSDDFKAHHEIIRKTGWLALIGNPKTKKAYLFDVIDFIFSSEINSIKELCNVSTHHLEKWKKILNEKNISPSTIRRKLSSISSLMDHLQSNDFIDHNPVKKVMRPCRKSIESKTPSLDSKQVKKLLKAPDVNTIKGKRDRAILSVFLYHALKCNELCSLKTEDLYHEEKCYYFKINGNTRKTRNIAVHPKTIFLINDYLQNSDHRNDTKGFLFRPLKNSFSKSTNKALSQYAIYNNIVKYYSKKAGIEIKGLCTHSLRVTSASNALKYHKDMTLVQTWLGHSSITTTRLYNKTKERSFSSPTYSIKY